MRSVIDVLSARLQAARRVRKLNHQAHQKHQDALGHDERRWLGSAILFPQRRKVAKAQREFYGAKRHACAAMALAAPRETLLCALASLRETYDASQAPSLVVSLSALVLLVLLVRLVVRSSSS
jgi:hypothetical protein